MAHPVLLHEPAASAGSSAHRTMALQMRFTIGWQREHFLGQEVEVVAEMVYSIRQVGQRDAVGRGDAAGREE